MKQEDLQSIFNKLKPLLAQYEPSLIARCNSESKYELWSEKEVLVLGKKRKEIYFAALVIQSAYVGFYFMPVYIDESIKSIFKPELLKLLKGKSCFHIKNLDDELFNQVRDALALGFKVYKENGWI